MSIEVENRRFLEAFDPDLLAELPDAGELRAEPARKQGLTLKTAAGYVHSKYHPAQEAAALIGRVKDPPQKLHVHFGFGLGYYAEADQPLEGGAILAYEPDPTLAATALAARPLAPIFRERRCRLACSLDRFRELMRADIETRQDIRVFISPYHRKTHAKALEAFVDVVKREANRKALLSQPHAPLYRLFLESSIRSWPHTTRLPGVDRLAGRFKNAPAVILVAGPSLEKNLPELVPHLDKVVVFTVARAARVLERWGAAPDFLVHNEAQDYWHLIDGCANLSQTAFLLSDQCHRRFFEFPRGPAFVYQNPGNAATQWLNRDCPAQRKLMTASAGSVATEAFNLALALGCNPIVLVGQDLALRGGRFYARAETNLNLAGAAKAMRAAPGFFGGKTVTLTNYLHFISWYEDTLREYGRRHPDRRFVNATEGGARIHGFEAMKLRDAARQWFHRKLPVAEITARAAEDRSQLLAPQTLADFLRRALEQVDEAVKLGDHFPALAARLRQRLQGTAPHSPRRAQEALADLQKQVPRLERLLEALPPLPTFFDQPLQASPETGGADDHAKTLTAGLLAEAAVLESNAAEVGRAAARLRPILERALAQVTADCRQT